MRDLRAVSRLRLDATEGSSSRGASSSRAQGIDATGLQSSQLPAEPQTPVAGTVLDGGATASLSRGHASQPTKSRNTGGTDAKASRGTLVWDTHGGVVAQPLDPHAKQQFINETHNVSYLIPGDPQFTSQKWETVVLMAEPKQDYFWPSQKDDDTWYLFRNEEPHLAASHNHLGDGADGYELHCRAYVVYAHDGMVELRSPSHLAATHLPRWINRQGGR